MAEMRVVQVPSKGGDFELVTRPLPEPGPGEVRVKIEACGICHSDQVAKDGLFPSVPYPIVPGHEIAGVIDAVGEGVTAWSKGTRVGVGWYGGHCGECDPCRRGDLIDCRNLRIPGVTYDGGYAEAMVAPQDALVRMPDDLGAIDAAPLLCAGVTTFNALRNAGASSGDVVAIQGIGGLGHLAVQYARQMGFRTVAIARGQEKAAMARELGAHVYIDSTAQDAAEELTKLGGAKVILATATSGKAMSTLVPGLAVRGRMMVIGISMDPIEISPLDLIGASRTIVGHASGAAIDSEDTLNFSALSGIRPKIETMPLERAGEAYDRMMRNEARFRMVLTTGQ